MGVEAHRDRFEDRLLRVLVHIHDHPEQDLSLDTLADMACVSRFHFHRIFRALTGETLADATRRIRLLRAANALVTGEAPLAEVAKQYGYPNVSSFSRAFLANHGMSPGVFRRYGEEIAEKLFQAPGNSNLFNVRIQQLPPCRAAGIVHRGPYTELARSFQMLGAVLGTRGLFTRTHGVFAVHHDFPGSKPEPEMRAHAAVFISGDFPRGIEDLEYFDVAGGRYAILEHTGPQATLGSAYAWLYGTWLPQSSEEPEDLPPIELYISDPRTTPPQALRTDLRLPLV